MFKYLSHWYLQDRKQLPHPTQSTNMDISIYSVHIGAESEVKFSISQLLPTSNAQAGTDL